MRMIGIITQPLGYNYGGILQNYALQRALKKLGYASITIDDAFRYSYARYLFSCMVTIVYKAIGKRRSFPLKPRMGRDIPSVTSRFIYDKISIAKSYEGLTEKTMRKYGITTIIVGSDQVWRPAYNASIYKMYLDCVSNGYKKIAYAASFGTEEWEYSKEQTRKCSTLLQSFDGVSVREKSGINLVSKHLDYNSAVLVLDPTLLLQKSDYIELCNNTEKSLSKYLCAYVLDLSDEKRRIIQEIALEKRLEVKMFSAHDNMSLTVEEWLDSFRNASFVITDSFHGTVFSIIFERDFVVLQNDARGNDRFVSLLSSVGLSDRVYAQDKIMKDIDWNLVNNNVELMRNASYSFLKSHLQVKS